MHTTQSFMKSKRLMKWNVDTKNISVVIITNFKTDRWRKHMLISWICDLSNFSQVTTHSSRIRNKCYAMFHLFTLCVQFNQILVIGRVACGIGLCACRWKQNCFLNIFQSFKHLPYIHLHNSLRSKLHRCRSIFAGKFANRLRAYIEFWKAG